MTSAADILKLPDGTAVGLAEYGDPQGEPVLALHGAPASRLMYAVADEPARRLGLRLFALDRPGYGLTPPDRHPTLAGRTEWHMRVAAALGLDRFAVLGISGGAPYAVALSSRLGDRLKALSLVCPLGPVADFAAESGARENPGIARGQRFFFLSLPRRHSALLHAGASLVAFAYKLAPWTFGSVVRRTLGAPDARILSQPHVRRRLIAMVSEALRSGPGGGIADLTIFAEPWNVDYAGIAAPVTIWQGMADPVVPVAASLYLAQSIPGCRLHRIEGAGHYWVFDHVEEVLAEFERSIAGNAAA